MAEKSKTGKNETLASKNENSSNNSGNSKPVLTNSVSTDSGNGPSPASSNNSSTKSTKNAAQRNFEDKRPDLLSNLVVAGHQQSVLVQASQQQLTIRDAFDPDDSETKHITTSSYWLNDLAGAGTQSQLFSQTNVPSHPKPPVIPKLNATAKAAAAPNSPTSSPLTTQVLANTIGKLNILPLKANESIFINNTHNNKQPKTFAITSNTSSSPQSPASSTNAGYNSLTSSRYYYSNFNTLSSSTSSNSPLNGTNGTKQGKYFTKTTNNGNNNNMSYIQQILNVKSKPVLTANGSSALSNSNNLSSNSSNHFMNSSQNGSIFNKTYTTSLSYYNYGATSSTSMNRSSYYKYLNGNPTTVNGVLGAKSITASVNKVNETKYVEYRRKWLETLRKEKRKFDTRWSQQAQKSSPTIKLDELEFRRTLGTGSFGRVILIKISKKGSMESSISDSLPQGNSSRYYALKVLEKRNVIKTKQVEHTLYEKKILSAVSFPFIASMYASFKDNANLYLLLEFVSGGEMFAHLTRVGRFSEKLCKFYCAQVILAIEYLHSLDIIHRDLKPENTLIAQDGYIKISDFGFAKYVKTRTYTLCGKTLKAEVPLI